MTIKEFYNKAGSDKNLHEAFVKAEKENKLAAFISEQGIEGTEQELQSLIEQNKAPLEDSELGSVTGGSGTTIINGVTMLEEENPVFRYHVGDWVEVAGALWGTNRAQIIDRKTWVEGTNCGSWRNIEYYVRYDSYWREGEEWVKQKWIL